MDDADGNEDGITGGLVRAKYMVLSVSVRSHDIDRTGV